LDDFPFIYPDDQTRVWSALKTLEQGTSCVVQNRNYRKDGTVVYCEWYNSAMINSPGGLVWGLSLALDVTERHKMEEALRENEQRLISIYNTVADIIFQLAVEPDGRFRFISVNAAFLKVTGLSRDAIIGKTVTEVVPEPSRTLVLAKYRQAVELKTIVRWEETSDYPGGRLTGEVSIAPVLNENGKCTHLVGSVHDITERKQVQEALRASEEKYRNLFEAAPIGIFQSKISGRFLSANPRLAAMFGYDSPDELISSVRDCTTDTYVDGDQRRAVLRRIKQTKGYVQSEVTYKRKDGSQFICNLYMRAVDPEDPDSTLEGFNEDITERKQAEAELREAHLVLERRVVERTVELSAANERLTELDRLKSQFLASMSHELRTPLNSIIGFTSLLRRGLSGPVSEEQAKQLGIVQSSAAHLLGLINDLLDVSRVEAGKADLQCESFNFVDVVNEVLRIMQPIAERKGLPVVTSIRESISMIGDRKRAVQILLNLVANAVKFTETGSVTISACVREKALYVEVSDTGIGIKPQHLGMLFEAFRQLDGSAKRIYEGTGLGLYLCRKLLTMMGGEIRVESEYGTGSRFMYSMPLQLPAESVSEVVSNV
jgi:PAS domain S-box-containing protein